ncbi:MAG TPA: SpoIIE family protein phosphatase [Thermoanaerobaculia bacterium]|nr:SpoIIE family protein phosphatase [Thermoanaerobaculia bacterium]
MRIRTQLILAAFVLAVVPLAAIVTYSYHSSRRALEAAYRREADRLTQQMDRRLAGIRAELDQRMNFVSALAHDNTAADVGNIVTVMGEASSLVDALEYKPLPHQATRPPEPPVPAEPPPPPAEDADEAEEVEIAEVEPIEPMAPREPIVIELPPVPEFPRYVISEAQQELIGEIAKLGVALSNRELPEDERKDLRAEMTAAQRELRKVLEADRAEYRAEMAEAQAAMRERQRIIDEQRREQARAQAGQAPPAPRPPSKVIVKATPDATAPVKVATRTTTKTTTKAKVRATNATDIAQAAATAKKTSLILGRKFEAPVHQQGEVVGRFTARISPEQVIRRVLGSAADDRSELPFALDREGTLYTRNDVERAQLDRLRIPARVRAGQSLKNIEGWIVSTSVDPQSGLKIGVARAVDNLDELRNTAARNFGLGMGLIALALIGIVPLSNHLTRDVKLVTLGADRIAHGDLMTRLPVKTNNELGQLARAFNRMAEDLSIQQQLLLEQERTRKEQEMQQKLLEVEYERKSVELEDARRFQLSMLPKEVPQHDDYAIAVFTRTATEVGGDYYDFHVADSTLSVTIGDATGHGAKAGTMVTVIKTLFAGYNATTAPADFLFDAAEKIKRMELGRMAMALSLGRLDGRTLTLASAGMPPVLIHRAANAAVEEIALEATPLGTFGSDYPQAEARLESGDTVLFLTDGFPELMNDAGQQLGYVGALDAFATAALAPTADGVIAALAATARRWHGDAPPNDDVTFVVVRVA